MVVFNVRWQFVPESLPKLLRVPGQGELRLGIIHDYDVAHSGGSGAAAHNFAIDHGNPQAAAGELVRTGGAYNSGAHNHRVVSRVGHDFSFARRYFELVYTTLLGRLRLGTDQSSCHHRGHRGVSRLSACWL